MSDARRRHLRAFVVSILAVTAVGAVIGACTNYQRANGEGCLKDIDCTSGYCQAQVCATPLVFIDGSPYGEASTSEDAGTAPSEASTPNEAGPSEASTGGG
jgi:hypothetical protein